MPGMRASENRQEPPCGPPASRGTLRSGCVVTAHLTDNKINTVLARHYGFTNEARDFIVNGDYTCRLGGDAGDEMERVDAAGAIIGSDSSGRMNMRMTTRTIISTISDGETKVIAG